MGILESVYDEVKINSIGYWFFMDIRLNPKYTMLGELLQLFICILKIKVVHRYTFYALNF